jgi:hypothetical protein
VSYSLPDQEITQEFADMWRAAGRHLQNCGDGRMRFLKADLYCPMVEHLSFRIGNQLVFVQVVDLAGEVHGPGSQEGLVDKAAAAGATPCLIPMRKQADGSWSADFPRWGLLGVETAVPFDPVEAVTSAPVELTDWEIHDFAIQIVRNHLKDQGRQLMGYCSDLDVNPSLWFIGDEGPEWVVIRGVRYPATEPNDWPDLGEIADSSRPLAKAGNTAVVRFAHVDQGLGKSDPILPILRGEPVEMDFSGLERV